VHTLSRQGLAVLALLTLVGCRKRARVADCEALVRHFAEVSAKESDASAGEVAAALRSAKSDPEALACSDEVEARQAKCALAATTSEGILDCLER
jgi:uncharacterized lipoprotein NlpE involved in copper resistance